MEDLDNLEELLKKYKDKIEPNDFEQMNKHILNAYNEIEKAQNCEDCEPAYGGHI